MGVREWTDASVVVPLFGVSWVSIPPKTEPFNGILLFRDTGMGQAGRSRYFDKRFERRICENRQESRRQSVTLAALRSRAEKCLQDGILKHRLMYDFKRPIRSAFSFCVVGFYFPRGRECPLVVDIGNGGFDDRRVDFIRKNTGATVLKFTNEEVMTNLDGVMQKILAHHPIVMSPPVD